MEKQREGNIENVRTACNLLIRLAARVVASVNEHSAKTNRVMLFQLLALRASRLAEGCLLLDGSGYVEEVSGLTRTLAEVVTNACYLQISNDQEVESFCAFDLHKSIRTSENLAKKIDATDVISDAERTNLQRIAAKARTRSQRKDKDISWSTDHIGLRAEKLDATMGRANGIFSLLKQVAYEFAHPFIHGTYQSLRAVRRFMSEGTFPSDGDREFERVEAMRQVNLCLLALCFYAKVKFGLPIQSDINEATRINQAP